MKIKIKKLHKDAVIPLYSKPGDAGMDLTAISRMYDQHGNVVYGTGLAFEIPEEYVGLLFPRSSNSKQDLILSNSVGVLDSGYRGEVLFKFKPSLAIMNDFKSKENETEKFSAVRKPYSKKNLSFLYYEIGDRIGQIIIMPYPKVEFEEVEELSNTERGIGGFGSTGS